MIPEPKCLVCGYKLEQRPPVPPEPPNQGIAFECPRCGFLIAQPTIEQMTRDQDNGA